MSRFTAERLSQVFHSAKWVSFDSNSKIIIMSDCHRGDGNWGDSFMHNQNIYFAALSFYYQNGYTYIELGDGDELWENRNYEAIIDAHNNVFWLLSKFYNKNRLYMLYGNHDIVKKNEAFVRKICTTKNNPCDKNQISLFSNIEFYEGLLLVNKEENQEIFLAHGHQGDLLNDYLWRMTRFLVRYIWRPLELVGFRDPTRTSTNYSRRKKVERDLIKWVEENNQMMIVGHTHRPVFPNEGEPLYFNDGSCIHPRCITGIEICNSSISLVKWSILVDVNQSLYVGRTILEGPTPLKDFINKNKKDSKSKLS